MADILYWMAAIASVAGALCVVVAYYLISTDRLTNNDARYQWINLIGALLIASSLYHFWNLGTLLIEVVWIVISIQALIRIKKANRSQS